MGMAASQARFLQLTARRTNIEYMGQQINQQRLALANASAGLFEKMLSMVPPTPPSSQDDKYYTQGYKFTDPKDNIQKSMSWTSGEPEAADFTAALTATGATDYSFRGTQATAFTLDAAGMAGVVASATETADIIEALGLTALTADQLANGYQQIFRNVTTEHSVYNADGALETKTTTAPALLIFDNLNRLISFTSFGQTDLNADPLTQTASNKPNTVDGGDLTYGGTFDSIIYSDDVNKYEFQKAAYDYQVERINQETRQIQAQDKSLELKMKQLDTEHNAVQTEMEAVQKVISKNIEGSFKTFA